MGWFDKSTGECKRTGQHLWDHHQEWYDPRTGINWTRFTCSDCGERREIRN